MLQCKPEGACEMGAIWESRRLRSQACVLLSLTSRNSSSWSTGQFLQLLKSQSLQILYECALSSTVARSMRSAKAPSTFCSSRVSTEMPLEMTWSRACKMFSQASSPSLVKWSERVLPSVACSRLSIYPKDSSRSTRRTVPACVSATPLARVRIESPGAWRINANAAAAGPSSGAVDEEARLISSASANG